jgi:anti-sigma-K factor RskA
MIDERQEELASLHALGLLEGAEREQFPAEMRSNAELRRLVAELEAASAAISHLAPPAVPPAALKARILASAAESPAAEPAVRRVIAFPSWVPWLAAASVGIAVWYGSQYYAARKEIFALREEKVLAQAALERARGELERSGRQIAALDARLRSEGDLAHYKIATLASMLGNSPAAVAVAVWDPAREQGVLSVSKLPPLAKEKDYQLWIIDAQYPNPVNGGVFVVDPVTGEAHIVFRGDKPIKTAAKFAVSLERKGGVPKAEGPIVLLSQ